jgi:YbbR domain-containing protein
LIQGPIFEPPIIDVHIEIEQTTFSRSMAVTPELSGQPADGYNVVAVSVTPSTVVVGGDDALIQGTLSIETQPVDIEGQTEDVVRTVSLDLPPGGEVTGGVPVVTVTVKIEPAQGVLTFNVPISPSNLGQGLAIQGALPSVNVQLRGESPTLLQLTPNDVLATVDLAGRGPGTHTLPVAVSPPGGTTVQLVTPAEVQITLGQP